MWFRNLSLYRFTKPFELTPEALEEQLEARPSRPLGDLEPAFTGWTPPLGEEGGLLVHTVGNCLMVCARKEEKILPPAVVRELVAEKAAEIEDKEGRKLGAKARRDLKENIIFEMLPRAFSKSSRHYAYIDGKNGWLVVDTPSASRAEELISLLRECLGSFPVVPLATEESPVDAMTQWLKERTSPPDIEIGDECELRDLVEDGAIVRVRREDLFSDEIQAHVQSGKRVMKLALTWKERVSFILDEHFVLRRLRFEDAVLDEAGESQAETYAERFDADFALMSGELQTFLPALIDTFGGQEDQP
ncbi:recombination-associated protein RdgC [Thiolapillus brandeum]|uniref:Recombination-associated protein RdgC n=1 Tax=Thiolapillus brandeum TaxID=1076588 RepID=A0A7U6GKK6_9GAMM|nr:recombination-associated protein RdgC [Thiolapillus brandeum]BAO45312.1 recombination associated protein [Thiolapillus brandeum]